ncbi:MAG: ribosomal RNA small subunit methyltransferase A [archaeon]|nr:ribosomal RNA small subunit methyltransferase A [archaeon]MCP8306128.1 ribosomal RNA small subunit methyltransferase A [archaeon]
MKRRRLGQHSLIDEEMINEMVMVAEVSGRDVVFEFGSGTGNLTEILCERAGRVVSYEIDENFYNRAKSRLGELKNLKLIHGDALKSRHKFNKLVSNIPYSKSREFIIWLSRKSFERAVITVQKEFAEKLLSQQGSKDYKAITVIARASFDMEPLKVVGRDSFKPRPRVDSLMLLLKPKPDKIDDATISSLKLLFSFRGKKVGTAIKMICKREGKNYEDVLKKFNLEILQKRVEQLSVEESVRVVKELADL